MVYDPSDYLKPPKILVTHPDLLRWPDGFVIVLLANGKLILNQPLARFGVPFYNPIVIRLSIAKGYLWITCSAIDSLIGGVGNVVKGIFGLLVFFF